MENKFSTTFLCGIFNAEKFLFVAVNKSQKQFYGPDFVSWKISMKFIRSWHRLNAS